MLSALIVILVSLVFLIIASYCDLRTGEVPEKISRGYIFSMLFLAFLFSIFTQDYKPFVYAATIGVAYFVFGYLTYYFGQWGGGDVKILAGIGISLGLLYSLNYEFPRSTILPYYLGYFIDMGIVMIPYVFLYGLFLGSRNRSVFQEYFKSLKNKKFIFVFIFSFFPSAIAMYFGIGAVSLFYLVLPFFLLVSIYMKILEKTALVETIPVSRLREGDVLVDDLMLDNKKISSKNINGLEQEEIEKIKKLSAEGKFPKEVKIKFGIKSVPILTMAFLAILYFGNFLELLLV